MSIETIQARLDALEALAKATPERTYYPGFGWHAFRRLNVTWRQHAGASPMEVQRAAGHSTLDMSLLYTFSDAERERQQVQWIADRLMGETGAKPQ